MACISTKSACHMWCRPLLKNLRRGNFPNSLAMQRVGILHLKAAFNLRMCNIFFYVDEQLPKGPQQRQNSPNGMHHNICFSIELQLSGAYQQQVHNFLTKLSPIINQIRRFYATQTSTLVTFDFAANRSWHSYKSTGTRQMRLPSRSFFRQPSSLDKLQQNLL